MKLTDKQKDALSQRLEQHIPSKNNRINLQTQFEQFYQRLPTTEDQIAGCPNFVLRRDKYKHFSGPRDIVVHSSYSFRIFMRKMQFGYECHILILSMVYLLTVHLKF